MTLANTSAERRRRMRVRRCDADGESSSNSVAECSRSSPVKAQLIDQETTLLGNRLVVADRVQWCCDY